jgi:hypothetical protein
MSSKCITPKPRFKINPSPITIQHFEDIKLAINQYFVTHKNELPFIPKRYSPAHYVMVKYYSFIYDMSPTDAAEELNYLCTRHFALHHKRTPLVYKDKKRKHRFYPHQTDVDKFYRGLTEKTAINVFKSVLDRITQWILNQFITTRSWNFIADNTKYPYYGKKNEFKHIKNTKLPGTKVA